MAGPDELQGYLEALMAKLLEVVKTGNSETQDTALGAIASAANAAGPSFQPYVAAVFPVLRQYMEVWLLCPFLGTGSTCICASLHLCEPASVNILARFGKVCVPVSVVSEPLLNFKSLSAQS